MNGRSPIDFEWFTQRSIFPWKQTLLRCVERWEEGFLTWMDNPWWLHFYGQHAACFLGPPLEKQCGEGKESRLTAEVSLFFFFFFFYFFVLCLHFPFTFIQDNQRRVYCGLDFGFIFHSDFSWGVSLSVCLSHSLITHSLSLFQTICSILVSRPFWEYK